MEQTRRKVVGNKVREFGRIDHMGPCKSQDVAFTLSEVGNMWGILH